MTTIASTVVPEILPEAYYILDLLVIEHGAIYRTAASALIVTKTSSTGAHSQTVRAGSVVEVV